MTTQPGDQTAGVGDHGHLRASHADREQVIGTLKAAFVQGMLAKDEFDLRVGQAFASRTHADLAAVTAGIHAGVAAIQPPRTSARGRTRKPVSKVKVVAWVASVISVLAALVAVAALLANNNQDSEATLFFASAWTFIGASTIAWAAMAEARAQKRSRGRLTQGPASGAGGKASRRPASAGPGSQLPPADPGHRHAGEAAPIRRPRPPRRGHFLRRQYATN